MLNSPTRPPAGSLIANETLNGISYVRFASMAKTLDKAGFLVDSVRVDIKEPYAPACSPEYLLMHEKRYVKKIVSIWSSNK